MIFIVMSTDMPITDTIPRLNQLVPHMRDQLIALRHGLTFEESRLRYAATVDQLVSKGLGRRTLSRAGDKDAYWSPTQEVLQEAMRLKFVEQGQLPSARRYLDQHRYRTHQLTELGQEVANLAESDPRAFYQKLSLAVIQSHPYFLSLLRSLESGPLLCPEITEREVEEARKKQMGTNHWVEFAEERINTGPLGPVSITELIREDIVKAVRRRFGKKTIERPTSKALSEALNDAFAAGALRSRGLTFGAIDLRMLKTWGSQLRLLDQSRYVQNYDHSNLIWIAADIGDDINNLTISARGLSSHGSKVAAAVVDAYQSRALASDSTLAAPYVPIYIVRAEAAYKCGVTRALTDLVIEKIVAGEFPDLGIRMWLHLGRGDQSPASEPVYNRGGGRRYDMTLNTRRVEE